MREPLTKTTRQIRRGQAGILIFSALLLAQPQWAAPSNPESPPIPVSETSSDSHSAIDRVLDDYIRLYSGETLARWKTLFHPDLRVAYPAKDGSISTLNLADFFQRQRNYFDTGRRISERLENVRIEEGRRIARVTADFVFINEEKESRGKLGLHVLQEHDAWKIVAIVFSYDDDR